jgi:hypothetical protein
LRVGFVGRPARRVRVDDVTRAVPRVLQHRRRMASLTGLAADLDSRWSVSSQHDALRHPDLLRFLLHLLAIQAEDSVDLRALRGGVRLQAVHKQFTSNSSHVHAF